MLFGYLIDYFCKIILIGLAVVAVGVVVGIIILAIGEMKNWW